VKSWPLIAFVMIAIVIGAGAAYLWLPRRIVVSDSAAPNLPVGD
jgi:hypothetical protein